MKLLVSTLAALALLFFIPADSGAISGTSGVSVSPAILNVHAGPSQTSLTFKVSLTNNTASAVNVLVRTDDFNSLGENGQINFYTRNYNSKTNPHGLSYWMHPALSELALSPGLTQQVSVTIKGIKSMTPGGHYGALAFLIEAPVSAKGVNVSNNQVLSTLVFFQTSGDGIQKLSLQPPQLSGLAFNLPSTVSFALSDRGNTQTVPYGYAALYRESTLISKTIINHGSGLVLPGSTRLFNVALAKVNSGFFGGSYKLVLAYRASDASSFNYYTKNILLVGWFWPLLAFCLLIAGAIVLLWRRKTAKLRTPAKTHKVIRYSSLS